MSADTYLNKVQELIGRIRETQVDAIERAGAAFAKSIRDGGQVYLFGSGHSVIPVLDIFPRYGGFVGFRPILDPRLMWFNIVGPGGARELLWLERTEGYIAQVLKSYELTPRDSMLVFSHGGLNAAPVEMALAGKAKGLTVVSVSSHANHKHAKATHSSGKMLADVADIAIDNCVPLEDALIEVDGIKERFSAGSTVATVSVAQALVAATGVQLVKSGVTPPTFVSPNVGLPPDHNEQVFRAFERLIHTK